MLDMMCMTFGGRAAEQVIFGKISTGAQNDLDKVTKQAYDMITVYGMDEEVGQVSFYSMGRDAYQRPYSDETSTLIDNRVRTMLDKQYVRAQELLTDKRVEVELLAKELLDKEVLTSQDLIRLIGPRPVDVGKVPPVARPGVVDNSVPTNGSGS